MNAVSSTFSVIIQFRKSVKDLMWQPIASVHAGECRIDMVTVYCRKSVNVKVVPDLLIDSQARTRYCQLPLLQ